MMTNRFKFENKDYIIALQDDNSVVFYREEADTFSWFSEPNIRVSETNDIKHSVRLLRLAANKIRQNVYKNKVKYFSLTVPNDKLRRITLNFLKTLHNYDYQVSSITINVFRRKVTLQEGNM